MTLIWGTVYSWNIIPMLDKLNKYNSTTTVSSLDMASATGNAPKFTGAPHENFSNWKRLFTLFIQSKEVNQAGAKFYLLCSLEGEAKNFYEFIKGEEMTVENTIMELTKRFEKQKSRSQTLNEIEALRKQPCDTCWVLLKDM